MNVHQFEIIRRDARSGTPPSLQEPRVGRWYCACDVYTGLDASMHGLVDYGQLGRYEGEGVFVDEDGEGGYEAVDMTGDYLQEQMGGAALSAAERMLELTTDEDARSWVADVEVAE